MKKSPLLILFFTVLIDLIGFGLVLPLLPNYAREMGASSFEIGLIASAYSFMQFFFAPAWGSLSDRIGRRPVILISVATSAFSYFFFSQANTILLLLLSRILAGIGSANVGVTQAYITDISDSSTRSKSLGILGAAFGLGFVLGPPIGGLIKTYYGGAAVGYSAALITLLDFGLAYFLLPESLTEKRNTEISFNPFHGEKLAAMFRFPAVNRLYLTSFCFVFAFVNMQITIPLLWKEKYSFSDADIGFLFSMIAVVSVVVQGGLIGKLVRIFGERKLLPIGLALMLLGIGFLPFVPASKFLSYGSLTLIILALGNGLCNPINTSLVSLYTPKDAQGEILGVLQSVGSLGRVIAPFTGSLLYGIDLHAPYLTGSLSLFIGLIVSFSLASFELNHIKEAV
ncbi:MAG: MFS transporter [Chloroherpetonaceae bacterium]|nr:MFS transporter [Chloroherpetonaceae bacterium]